MCAAPPGARRCAPPLEAAPPSCSQLCEHFWVRLRVLSASLRPRFWISEPSDWTLLQGSVSDIPRDNVFLSDQNPRTSPLTGLGPRNPPHPVNFRRRGKEGWQGSRPPCLDISPGGSNPRSILKWEGSWG